MPGSVIHVYHESADYLVDRIKTIAPLRPVIGLKTPVALRAAIPEIEILFAPMPPRDGWAAAEKLRLVQLLGAGVDQLLPSPDLPSHVQVAGVRGEFAAEVTEHALALMLSHARGLPAFADAQRAKKFEAVPRAMIAGERVTIIGNGEIGKRIARASLALDLRVRVVSRTGEGETVPGAELVARDALASAIGDAKFVVIAVPLTPATTRLFDASMIAHMRSEAYLVNVARGGIVDEAALAEALSAGRLGGAALDVFDEEPLAPEHPLWGVPRLTITPHVAGLGLSYIERCIDVLMTNVAALEAGAPLKGLINRDVGY
ncbi:MAG TPA: D-2-hydroxyacid dehydrogenase [Kofleriaceae bacterium]|jgi:phosphoglycerate dehydrogenase-like enzyme|nr:D-2-hydroxyacid dehydrogenase [Kofleriaceae bacterium]